MKRTKAQDIALDRKRKQFVRGVKAGHAMRQAAKVDALRARNCYLAACGLPLVTKI